MTVAPLGRGDLRAITAVVDAALPAEAVHSDDLETWLFDEPGRAGAVLGAQAEGGLAAVTAVRVTGGEGRLTLLATRPRHQRRGLGGRLLAAAEDWARRAGALTMQVGDFGSSSWGLWPGVDAAWVAALGLLEASGYERRGTVAMAALATRFRAKPPETVAIERVLDEQVADVVRKQAAAMVPRSAIDAAVEHGTLLAARAGDTGRLAGVAVHSVRRFGWLDHLVVAPGWRRRGAGSALLGAVARDLMGAGMRQLSLVVGTGGAGGAAFCRAVGAGDDRRFVTFAKELVRA